MKCPTEDAKSNGSAILLGKEVRNPIPRVLSVRRAEDEELPMRVGFWNPENQEIQILENVPFDLNLTTGF